MLAVEQLECRDCLAGPVLLVPIPAQAAPIPAGITVVVQPPPIVVNATVQVLLNVERRAVVVIPAVLVFERVVPIAVAVPIFLDGRPEVCPLFYALEDRSNG